MAVPEIQLDQLTAEQLLNLRQQIDEKLDAVRASFVDQAERLGLVVTNGAGKRKRRAAKHHDHP